MRQPPNRIKILRENDATLFKPALIRQDIENDVTLWITCLVRFEGLNKRLQFRALSTRKRFERIVFNTFLILTFGNVLPAMQHVLSCFPPSIHGASHPSKQQSLEKPRPPHPCGKQVTEFLGQPVCVPQIWW